MSPAGTPAGSTGRPIRWGVLGTGWIAGRFVEDLRRLPDAEVVAVGSRTAAAAGRFASRYAIPHAHGSWAGFAADDRVDVVYVATPHASHHAATALCLDAGRPVLCEKPFTLNADQAADLVARARAAGLFLMEAMWMRCVPAIRRLVTLVRDGAIGQPRLVQADFGLVGPDDPGHRLRDPALGGGALLDLGVYPVTLAQMLLGEPDSVTGVATLSRHGVDETTALVLGYPGGALASLTCSIVADTPWTATVCGSAGRIELGRGFFRPARLSLYTGDGEPRTIEVPYQGEGFVHEAVEVMRCLRAGLTESPLAPLADTVGVLRVTDAVRARTGVRYPADDEWRHPVDDDRRSPAVGERRVAG
ncbi:Gfo/Idh/MocA family protein [Plantactinospora sp. WMMB782]|uniref:Gfo/Idh/MocA family protein n=1 Tax=Plantactinospora sp. WMMB782 TaxID=3404121 RepID=UPI003B944CE5